MITTPALVTQDAAARLPRLALWLMTGLYLLPGLLGRDPWRNAELTAYGIMLAMAEGRTSWWQPALAQVVLDVPLPAHWLGAISIGLLQPLGIEATLAARLPFLTLLGATLGLVWWSCYRLARTEAAQPVAFAFGGEADATAYARALADSAVLAFMATLGVLQLGHEATPEILQLTAGALVLWVLSAPSERTTWNGLALVLALSTLAASGAPGMALLCALACALIAHRTQDLALRPLRAWAILAAAAAAVVAAGLDTWNVRLPSAGGLTEATTVLRLLAWFTWPTAALAAVTVWRWRRQWTRRHLAAPGLMCLIPLLLSIAMGGADRVLLLAVPGLAVLAAFALPTLKRSGSAAIDWFSVFFFTGLAVLIWVVYLSLQTGWPESPARNAQAVAPDYQAPFQAWALAAAAVGTLCWIWLVRWRTAKHRKALWKSLTLPACGVILNWLLAMTLLLHPLDYTRSLTPWVQALEGPIGPHQCLAAPGMPLAYAAALESQGGWRVDARPDAAQRSDCDVLLLTEPKPPETLSPVEGWITTARVRRPTERHFATLILRRTGSPGAVERAPLEIED